MTKVTLADADVTLDYSLTGKTHRSHSTGST